MNPLFDTELEAFLKDAPLFFQPWWLEAVSPGGWDYAVVKKGNEIVAAMPYAFRVKYKRWKLIETPRFTPYLGPWLRSSTAKYSKRLAEEKDVMGELIDLLPAHASFQMALHPGITNWLPFYWRGFHQGTSYTYRIEKGTSAEDAWKETNQNIRTDIRKAERNVRIVETEDIGRLVALHRLSFKRQNYPYPFDERMIFRFHEECGKRNACRLLIAQDEEGRGHAGIYLVKDSQTAYYLIGGGDPDLRNSGATSLLLWNGIQWALAQQLNFDFEGSMVEPIERFFRSFGARQTPYLVLTKQKSTLFYLKNALQSFRSHFRNR